MLCNDDVAILSKRIMNFKVFQDDDGDAWTVSRPRRVGRTCGIKVCNVEWDNTDRSFENFVDVGLAVAREGGHPLSPWREGTRALPAMVFVNRSIFAVLRTASRVGLALRWWCASGCRAGETDDTRPCRGSHVESLRL